MKNFLLLATGSALLLMFAFTSCKKEGCTDELAINYFSKVKKDDGSCSYSTTRIAGVYEYTWNDTIVDTATVYSLERSLIKLEFQGFDYSTISAPASNFIFLVTWSTKTMNVPDSLAPMKIFPSAGSTVHNGSLEAKINSKDKFTLTYTQEIPKWNNTSVKKDTVLTYEFTRI
ncbi:MAG: hypothetical protein WC044_00390 [Crocinitomicaceae bacterium]